MKVHHLLALYMICTVPWLGGYDFFTRGEAREALIVSDIVSRGEWVLPRGYDGAVASKPPLLHWLASTFATWGIGLDELSIRLPSALFALVCCLVFLHLSRERLTDSGRWLFAIGLMFAFEWVRASSTARVDMVHAASLAIGLLLGFFAMQKDLGNGREWLASTLAITLATLGKGPVALVLAATCLGAWGLSLGHPYRRRAGQLAVSIAASALAAGAWYLAAFLRSPGELFGRFWYENVQRMTGTMGDVPHAHSVVYLIGAFLLGMLPWTPFILMETYRFVRRLAVHREKGIRDVPDIVRFSLLCISIVLVFYSIPSSKRGVYLLVCYPFVSLVAALSLQNRMGEDSVYSMKRLAVFGCVALLFANSVVMPQIASRSSERGLSEVLRKELVDGQRVFSFGHEFYGASFYGAIPMWRIEEGAIPKSQRVSPSAGDLLVVEESDLEDAKSRLRAQHLDVKSKAIVPIGKKAVVITKLDGSLAYSRSHSPQNH